MHHADHRQPLLGVHHQNPPRLAVKEAYYLTRADRVVHHVDHAPVDAVVTKHVNNPVLPPNKKVRRPL